MIFMILKMFKWYWNNFLIFDIQRSVWSLQSISIACPWSMKCEGSNKFCWFWQEKWYSTHYEKNCMNDCEKCLQIWGWIYVNIWKVRIFLKQKTFQTFTDSLGMTFSVALDSTLYTVHIQCVLIGVEYLNCRRTFFFLFFYFLLLSMGK